MAIIVQWGGNWADEFDYDGFCIYKDKSEWEETLRKAKAYVEDNPGIELYYGTNEYIEFDSPEELDRLCTVTNITEAERKTIEKFFGSSGGLIDPYARLAEH